MKEWLKNLGIEILETIGETGIGIVGAHTMISELDLKISLSILGLSVLATALKNLKDIRKYLTN